MIVEYIGWLGFVLILFGYYYNAQQKIFCFYIWGIGNIFFLVYALLIRKVMTKTEVSYVNICFRNEYLWIFTME